MWAELGQVALLCALVAALVQGTLPLWGAARGHALAMRFGASAAQAQALAIALALALLTMAFVDNDFSLLYVAQNSNRALPLAYRVAGVWGGHEGSLLLWVAMLAGWTVAVTIFGGGLPDALRARILAVMGWITVGFLLFMLTTSNPFDRLLPAPLDGRDLNPLLQDPGMVAHPPMLYMGYVGFSVAFAFAIAALIGGDLDARWARWARPWTTAAWCCLTIGIALGSTWAYYELGWGGWWFWDPVENASFMPWLLGTALIHSLAVTEKRGAFKSWTVLLAILGFSLSLLGTFLVRSGVLSSVHAFATDPRRGLFILGFLVVVTGGALALYAWRAPRIGLGARFAPVSRESSLLLNNVLLAAATGTVLLGTLYPLILDALGLGKISVGPPYFEAVFVPLMLPLLLLAGFGPLLRWREADLSVLRRPALWATGFAIVGSVALNGLLGSLRPLPLLGVAVVLWMLAGIGVDLAGWWRRGPGWALRHLPRAVAGMMLAHLGVAVFTFGVTGVRSGELEIDERVQPGQAVALAGLDFRFDGVRDRTGPNYDALQATVTVLRDGQELQVMHPEKRVYRVQRNPMTEAAIAPGLLRDLYVSLGEEVAPGAWSLRVHVKPFVDWIWGGCLLMALGGAVAASDRRYWRPREATVPSGMPDGPSSAPVGAGANALAREGAA
ncbi:MAG: heme lyase CcmF/NrfE family subunit [Burkholderiaceae bacterium]|nr:heme lyase CcmF/NrfE family subunit [Burkholderiaceae bacterium]